MAGRYGEFGPSPQERWRLLRTGFVEEIFRSLLVLAFVALPVSLARSWSSGWQPLYSLHIGIAIVYLGLYRLRERIPLAARAAIPIAIYWVLALSSLLTLGLVGNGIFALTIINIMTALIYPPRATLSMIAVSLAVLAAIGSAIVSGRIVPSVNASEYGLQVSSWATTWALLCSVLMTIVRSIGMLQKSTQDLLQEVHERQEEIISLANHDQLTGLPLLRLARDRFVVASRQALRNDTKIAVFFVDLDGFKAVNDSWGHESGDCVLRLVAQCIQGAIRAEDTAARIGGDEFLVILANVGAAEAVRSRGEALLRALSQPIPCGGRTVQLGASIGIALFPDHASDLDVLRRLADGAMYEAKRSGNPPIRFVAPSDSD